MIGCGFTSRSICGLRPLAVLRILLGRRQERRLEALGATPSSMIGCMMTGVLRASVAMEL
jgi:hypothetical protein